MIGDQFEFPDELPNWLPRYDPEASDYVAAVVITAGILAVAVADVTATAQEIADGRDEEEIPESTVVIETLETTVRADGGSDGIESAADDLLAANGWRRTGPWEHDDDTAYATVERARG
ncbi:hypothetical protein [Actinomadura alba]|uniref:Uncharacterized protein n=1 Tax=Actinomadura alba TaxID=406431 RepID=A0ABR7M0M9_9ACTN|nr:hypothetical protein [Actinomadura alba]MBC6470277.1 hypothetical protein [Actinomadura alba]